MSNRVAEALANQVVQLKRRLGDAASGAVVFDLKAVNLSTAAEFDNRSPAEILQSIHAQGRIVTEALARLAALVKNDDVSLPMVEVARQ